MSQCECGNLTSWRTRSCGCSHKKHDKTNTRLYRIWIRMKLRCYNEKHLYYKYYGERNIKVCDEWLDDFQAFYDWAINNGYNDNLTIDRIDVNGNYEPSNCRWATVKQQNRNKRNNVNYTINGEIHCLKEWCEILGLKYDNVWARINKHHWSIERALELEE